MNSFTTRNIICGCSILAGTVLFGTQFARGEEGAEHRAETLSGLRLTGLGEVTSMPGLEVLVRFELSDPDGDWSRLRCRDAKDIEIRGNAVSWRMPWEFRGQRRIVLFAEDAWGATSPDHTLVVRSMDRET